MVARIALVENSGRRCRKLIEVELHVGCYGVVGGPM